MQPQHDARPHALSFVQAKEEFVVNGLKPTGDEERRRAGTRVCQPSLHYDRCGNWYSYLVILADTAKYE